MRSSHRAHPVGQFERLKSVRKLSRGEGSREFWMAEKAGCSARVDEDRWIARADQAVAHFGDQAD